MKSWESRVVKRANMRICPMLADAFQKSSIFELARSVKLLPGVRRPFFAKSAPDRVFFHSITSFLKKILEVGFEDLSISLFAQECFVGRKSRESFAAPRQHDKIHGVTR